jgi:hypothetical protein
MGNDKDQAVRRQIGKQAADTAPQQELLVVRRNDDRHT